MKVIVFGGTGGLGKRVVRSLLERGHECTSFSKNYPMSSPLSYFIPAEHAIIHPEEQEWIYQTDWRRLNLLSEEIDQGLFDGYETVINCIGTFTPMNNEYNGKQLTYHDVNVKTLQRIIDIVQKSYTIQQFITVSAADDCNWYPIADMDFKLSKLEADHHFLEPLVNRRGISVGKALLKPRLLTSNNRPMTRLVQNTFDPLWPEWSCFSGAIPAEVAAMVTVGMAENLHWDRTVLLENAKIKQEFQLMVESARRYWQSN